MTTLSLAFLIVSLLVVNLTGRLTDFENYFYSFPSKELSHYSAIGKIETNLLNKFTLVSSQTNSRKSLLTNLITSSALHKKNTTYYTNYFVEFKNIELLV